MRRLTKYTSLMIHQKSFWENAAHIGGFYFMRLATSERRVPDFIVEFMFTSVGECKVNEPTTVR